MAFHVGVNCLLIKDNKVLMGKRLKKAGYGTWGFPGGHLEMGESFIAAAKRELEEETGLIADTLEFSSLVNTPQADEHYMQVNFVVTEWHGELVNKEPDICEAWEWFPLDNLPEVFFSHKAFIDAYKRGQKLVDAQ